MLRPGRDNPAPGKRHCTYLRLVRAAWAEDPDTRSGGGTLPRQPVASRSRSVGTPDTCSGRPQACLFRVIHAASCPAGWLPASLCEALALRGMGSPEPIRISYSIQSPRENPMLAGPNGWMHGRPDAQTATVKRFERSRATSLHGDFMAAATSPLWHSEMADLEPWLRTCLSARAGCHAAAATTKLLQQPLKLGPS